MVRLPDSNRKVYLANWDQLSEKERRAFINKRDKEEKKRKRKKFLEVNNKCAYCERPFSETVKATIDHVIPQLMGGGNTVDNLVACCVDCNGLKDSLTISQYRKVVWSAIKILEGRHPLTVEDFKTIWANIYGPECKFKKYVDSEQIRLGRKGIQIYGGRNRTI